jgi:glycosyltransferase involved in cell wall biosynthesis
MAQANALRLPVDFRPFVDHRAMPAVLGEADVFVLPSRTEGHPKILLEAMSSGLACVASAVSGNRAIVDDGRTGLLVPPGDAGALAEALERVLVDTDERQELGDRARAAVAFRYDLGALVDREIALLQRVARG